MYKNDTLEKYLNDLAAKLPAPGGGSASAMTAAMGAALISMVVNFTLGKPKYAQYEAELKEVLTESEKLREEFLKLVDLDVEAYRSKNIRDSLNVPFMIARLCFEAVKLCPQLVKKTNVNLASDVAVAVIFLESAFAGACFNVEINLKMIKDQQLGSEIKKELAKKDKFIKKVRRLTEEKIGKIIRG